MNTIRVLSDEAGKQIAYFYKRPIPISTGTIFILCFGMMVPILIAAGFNWNPFVLILPFIAIVFFIDWYRHQQKVAKAKETYQYGDEVEIYLKDINSNWGFRLNGAPQQIVTIQKGEQLVKIKTFSIRVIKAFSLPVQKAYVYDKYPAIVLPSSIFSKNFYDPAQPKLAKEKSISINI